MLQINLLPIRQLKRRETAKGQLAAFSFLFALVVILCALAWFIQNNGLNSARQENASLTKEKQDLQPKLTLIDTLNKDKEELERKTKVIEQLKKKSSLTVRIMDEVANRLDNNRLWLISMVEAGGTVDLKGIARDNEAIAEFMDNMKNSPFVRDVSLTESSQNLLAGQDLKSFTISCQVTPPGSENSATKPNFASKNSEKRQDKIVSSEKRD